MTYAYPLMISIDPDTISYKFLDFTQLGGVCPSSAGLKGVSTEACDILRKRVIEMIVSGQELPVPTPEDSYPSVSQDTIFSIVHIEISDADSN